MAHMIKKVSIAATTMKPPHIMYAFGPSIPLVRSELKRQALGGDLRCAEDIGQCHCRYDSGSKTAEDGVGDRVLAEGRRWDLRHEGVYTISGQRSAHDVEKRNQLTPKRQLGRRMQSRSRYQPAPSLAAK